MSAATFLAGESHTVCGCPAADEKPSTGIHGLVQWQGSQEVELDAVRADFAIESD